MKLGQNVCLNNISDESENGSSQVGMFALVIICMDEKMFHFESKTRSAGQILKKKKKYIPKRQHFQPSTLERWLNVFLDDISD